MKNKSLIFLFAMLFMVVLSISVVSADDLQTTDSGKVSGDVDVAASNPWKTDGELSYDIPSDAKDVKKAVVYVNVYGGSAANTYGAMANVSLKTNNNEYKLAENEVLYSEYGSTNGTVYTVNDHTTKCYSDYQMCFDITDKLTGLNGSSILLKVNSFKYQDKQFDGRIKLIGLVLAYDDGDDDNISYWINSGQAWTKQNTTTTFATNANNILAGTLTNIALSSKDGSYMVNDKILGDPDDHKSGNFFQYNNWDVTDKILEGKNTTFLSMNVGSSLKNVLSVLKVKSGDVKASVSLATEYTKTCYAGTNNTVTITVNSNKNGKYVIELLADGKVVSSGEFDLRGEAKSILLTDPTIRSIDENTVSGANNPKVNYTVNVKLNDEILANSTLVVPVLYDGYLGKEYAYNTTFIEDIQKIVVSGGVITDIQPVSSYLDAKTLNRTDVWTIKLDNSSSLVKAYLYVSYNWDKSGLNAPIFNTTFNGVNITPRFHFRDQSNLGSSGKYGYGLFIYDVSDLIKVGDNSFVLKKNNLTAVYPSNLIYFYNTTNSDTITTVYLANGVDLLYASKYNEAGRTVSTSSSLVGVDTSYLTAAELYVFAASANSGDGDIIFNGVKKNNVWNGTSNSMDSYSMDILSTIKNSNDITFVSTGSTFVALQQMIITKQKLPTPVTVIPTALSTTYDSGKQFTVTVLDDKNNPINGLELNLRVFTGTKYVDYKVSTNEKGIASLDASKFAVGTHAVEITSNDPKYDVAKTSSSIKIAKAKTIVKAPKVKAKVKTSKYFKVSVKNKATKKAVASIKVKVKVYTGKKSKTYKIKTNKKGVAKLNTKKLKVGKHKVVISSGNPNYNIKAKSLIKIVK